jgi:ATP phosphoribosyltransferase
VNTRLLIALPKGRLFDPAIALFGKAGITIDASGHGSRRLTFTDHAGRYDFVTLKPVDIPVYVESGSVDAGVVGSDVLRERESKLFEPLDLRIGLCRMVVAAPDGAEADYAHNVSVATKYPRTAERFFRSRKLHVHIVKLDGSVEIAPLLGLSTLIVDLVETGRTLKENGMRIVEVIDQVSGRLIVNRTVMKVRAAEVNQLIAQLDGAVYANT